MSEETNMSAHKARNGAPLFEINMNDPKTTAPSDLITDIYVPLK
ncbi:GyrI-like domain-containing protein [Parvibaculaceae bacterium PLY_AMNH_Bact1]|nr:GyrI-like domain-containing protein [Parvibaculaceae bacterium PLY_AMNH_Bact1]